MIEKYDTSKITKNDLWSIFNSVYDAIFIHDLEGNIIDVNDKMLTMYEVTREEATQFTIPDHYSGPDNDLTQLPTIWQKVMAGEAQFFEWQARRPHDGSLFEAEVSLRQVVLTDQSVILATVRDISDRKQAEEALRRSEASLAAAQRIAHLGNWDWDVVANTLTWSDEIYRIFGLTPQEFGATVEAFFERVHPDDLDYVQQAANDALEKKESYQVEHRIVRVSGEVRYVYQQAEVTFDEAGHPLRMMGVVQDITEQKQAEMERNRLQQEIIEAQQQAIQELSTPIIPVMSGVIIIPLIGSVDSMRARDLMRTLLAGISDHRAKVVILDITGVPMVDTGIVAHLDKTIQAARLKGARTIVTGISDSVAEMIVDLGIDWRNVETLRDLQTGLKVAMTNLGVE